MPTSLAGPPPIRMDDGAELIARSGKIWRREGYDAEWASVHTLTDTTPILSHGARRTGSCYCLDASAVYSVDSGLTWQASPPADVLPAPIAAWTRGDAGIRAMLMDKTGNAVAMNKAGRGYLSFDGSADLSYRDSTFSPIASRDLNGVWYVGYIVSNGVFLEYYARPSGASWVWPNVHSQALGTGAFLASLSLWTGAGGMQVVTGVHESSLTVRVMARRGFKPANDDWSWSAPTTVATVAAVVAPYAMQTPTGTWEIGWYDGTGWTRYRAATPGGTWTEVV